MPLLPLLPLPLLPLLLLTATMVIVDVGCRH